MDPPLPVQRYEYAAPGDLLHLDTKKLGRFHRVGSRITGTHQKRSLGAGFEVAHVCIDDHSRLAYAEVLPNEKKETTTAFLSRALYHFQALGIAATRIMTDNGSAYRSHLIGDLCRSRRMRHIFTRPYTPRTNGKAERFIQTALREWAYARPYITPNNAPTLCCPGSIPTTITAPIAASAAALLSLASPRTTCCKPTPNP